MVRKLDGLREHAGYQYLLKIIREKQKKALSTVARRLMAGELVDQREIDFQRGYFRGALDVAERPEKAVADLERAARQAWVEAQLEVITEEESETPYV